MDNSDDVHTIAWSTPRAALVAAGVGGVVLATAAIATGADAAGRLLISLAAIGLLAVSGLGWYQRPRLAILSDKRLAVRRLRGSQVFGRDDLSRVRIVRYPRLGRRVPMLEIDTREPGQLLVFGRWDLGADPQDVLDALTVHGLVPTSAA